MDYSKRIQDYIEKEIEVLKCLNLNEINVLINLLEKARTEGNRVYICGNGGSAATASHYCCDFNKGISRKQEKRYNFTCLSDNVPSMLAIANDIGYEEIFRFPLQNVIKKGELFIGISGSGNSKNVVNAMEYAKSVGAITVALVGYDGGKMKALADYCVHVSINDMQISEDIHLIIDHLMMSILSSEDRC